jgi:type I restriction enzyme, S subunit
MLTEALIYSVYRLHRCVAYLGDLQAKINTLRELQSKSQEELDALLPSVLDKAFKGEL